jgi:drug/metabolite transporter (DMT)-like permease
VAADPHPLRRALPLFLLAGFCLTSLDTTAKYLVRDHSVFLVVWARYAGQMLIVTPWAWHRAGPGFWRTGRLRLQLARSTALVLATFCFFLGLRYLPLAEGSAITFLAPIFVVILSGPMLGERPTRARWAASIIGFVGVLIMLRPGSTILHPAVLLLIGTAVFNALFQITTRRLAGEDPRTTLFYSALVGTVAMSALLPFGLAGESLTAGEGGLLLLLGLLAGLGHWCFIAAYQIAPASMLTPYMYLQTIWATGYGYLVFGHIPDGWSALGMAVIVASGLLLALQEQLLRRGARPPRAL